VPTGEGAAVGEESPTALRGVGAMPHG